MLTSYSTEKRGTEKELKEYNNIKIHLCLWCSVKSLDIIPGISLCLYSQPIRPRHYSLLPQRQSFKLRGGGERRPEVLSQLWMILSRAELPELLGLGWDENSRGNLNPKGANLLHFLEIRCQKGGSLIFRLVIYFILTAWQVCEERYWSGDGL